MARTVLLGRIDAGSVFRWILVLQESEKMLLNVIKDFQ
jgi:hypothetical protein